MRPCDPVIEDGGDVMAACLLHCTTYRPQYICFSMKKMEMKGLNSFRHDSYLRGVCYCRSSPASCSGSKCLTEGLTITDNFQSPFS